MFYAGVPAPVSETNRLAPNVLLRVEGLPIHMPLVHVEDRANALLAPLPVLHGSAKKREIRLRVYVDQKNALLLAPASQHPTW